MFQSHFPLDSWFYFNMILFVEFEMMFSQNCVESIHNSAINDPATTLLNVFLELCLLLNKLLIFVLVCINSIIILKLLLSRN